MVADSKSSSPWPKNGLAGKTSAAQTHAPDGATDIEILTVGYVAWKESRDVSDVWPEVANGDIRGGESDG